MVYGLETMVTFALAIVSFVIVLSAQIQLTSTYKESKQKKNKRGLTGCEVAREILDKNELSDIYVVEVAGELSDHYDPSRKVVRLSRDIFHGESIAAMAVAAHECGHALQDKENYTLMRIRATLVPFVNLVTYLGYFGLIISLFAGVIGYLKLSIAVLMVVLIFQLITLPVEFNASKRAKVELEKLKLVDTEEIVGVTKMLSSAAMTYVASVLTSILEIIRLIAIFNNDR